METTTNLFQLKKLRSGAKFTWGEIIRFHHVGPYDIVEYHPDKRTETGRILTGETDPDQIKFYCYMCSLDLGISCESLEEALATCMAYKYDGINSQAARFFMRMIGRGE